LDDILDQVLSLLRSGNWEIDTVIVTKRLRARHGFAAISRGRGQSLELKAAGNVRLTEVLEVGSADLFLASSKTTTNFQLYEFGSHETPAFFPPWGVKHDLWGRLLPWRSEGWRLFDPTGRATIIENYRKTSQISLPKRGVMIRNAQRCLCRNSQG
jgi:hypothetical protein